MIDKASVLIDREVRMSFDPGITNFAIGTLGRLMALNIKDPIARRSACSVFARTALDVLPRK
jgi:hypothetical protein